MKRYSLIICLVLILSLSGVASAQVVLEDAGGIAHVKVAVNGATVTSFNTTYSRGGTSLIPPAVGYTVYTTTSPTTTMVNVQAAFEFNLTAVNKAAFTSKDFTARLDGLNVTSSYAYYGTGVMNVDLFDMGDAAEDGDVYYTDYNITQGGRIARSTHTFGAVPVPADFNNIDVTCAVRNDLFGTGVGDFSGFILKSPDAQYELVWYDDAPTLTITPGNPGPKCGSGGGGGGGGCFIANAAR